MVNRNRWLDVTPAGAKAVAGQLAQRDTWATGTITEIHDGGLVSVALEGSDEPDVIAPADAGVTGIGAQVRALRDSTGRVVQVATPITLPEGIEPIGIGVSGQWVERMAALQAQLDEAQAQIDQALADVAADLVAARDELDAANTDLASLNDDVLPDLQDVLEQATTDAQTQIDALDQRLNDIVVDGGGSGNFTTYSVNAPSAESTGTGAGDQWWQVVDGQAKGYWRWDGQAWQSVSITDAVLGTISVDLLRASEGHWDEAVVDQLWADIFTAHKITAQEITVGGVTGAALADNAISAVKIADGAVSANKIAANSISADKLLANAVTAEKLAANAVTATKIAALAITGEKIAASSITADKLLANSITADKLAGGDISGKTYTGGAYMGSSFQTSLGEAPYVRMSNGAWNGWPGIILNPNVSTLTELPALAAYGDDKRGFEPGSLVMHGGRTGTQWSRVASTPSMAELKYVRSTGEDVRAEISQNGADLFYNRSGGSGSARIRAGQGNAFISFIANKGNYNSYLQAEEGSVRMSGQGVSGQSYVVATHNNGASMSYNASDSATTRGVYVYPDKVQVAGGLYVDGMVVTGNARFEGDGNFTNKTVYAGAVQANGLTMKGASRFEGDANFTNKTVYSGAVQTGNYVHTNPPTTSASANLLVADNPAGRFYKSTSSRRYKKYIKDWTPTVEQVLALQPRTWVHRKQDGEEQDPKRYVGFVAEEVHDLGLTELVSYSNDENGTPRPEGLAYDRFAAAQQVVIRDQQARIARLEQDNTTLEDRLARIEARLEGAAA